MMKILSSKTKISSLSTKGTFENCGESISDRYFQKNLNPELKSDNPYRDGIDNDFDHKEKEENSICTEIYK